MSGVRLIIQFDDVADPEGMVAGMSERCSKVEANEPGCIQYEVFRSAMNPNRVVLLEHWASPELFDKHWAMVSAPRPAAAAALAAGSPPPAPRPTSNAEIYHQTYFDNVDGAWVPRNEADRIKGIRWA
jgi:quinol monooxygenase YgiN